MGRSRPIAVDGQPFGSEPLGHTAAANAHASGAAAIGTEHRGNAPLRSWHAGTANAGGSAAVAAAANVSFVQRGCSEAEQPGPIAR